jgi:hypothetical protein
MIKHPTMVGIALIAGALALTACGSSSPTAAAGSAAASTTAPATSASPTAPVTGSNSNGNFCTEMKQTQTNAASIASTFATSFRAGKFSAIKQTLHLFFQTVEAKLAQVEGTMTSAPANVQAALTTINGLYTQLSSAVDHSTSLAGLSAAIVPIGKNTQIRAATNVLAAYALSQCGSLPTASP